MAERPLYTLYKNLKAQNYDVPDDYNKFESALTRDGKGGADNRHAIYENLKAQNFDVPSTYERFYSALFEPRSKTSSRAKGGSVPMSAADRARFSAGAAAISASAQQTMNNAGRYNRLKQRKQKQQKDFGRVNLGTHQTPYGGDANNVVKDDFAYNPETGKTGAYVTSDNENVYSLPEAEQSQAQDVAYQNAVDTGEIPSVLDVRDQNGNYDLQENIGKNGTYLTEEGAQKQFDKKLADAYARKKEIEALIAEDNRQHGNPLLSYGASIGASNGRTAEQSDYRNKLATSLSLVTEQIGALEAVKQYPTSSWGEDALKALDNTAFTAKTWDFGLTDFAIMGQMERIKTKMDNNIPLSGSDKMLLKSKLSADAAAALEDEKMGNVYRWTKIAGQSLPFMADFFLTGGYGGITKGISRGALKFAAKRGMGKVGAAILKNTGIVAGDVIGSYAMAGTEQALKTGADIMQRHLGNLYQDEKGDYKFGTFDENGNLLHEGGESIGTALYKGMTYAMVENYTEKLFGHNYGIKKGAVNFMEKHGMNASAEFFKNIGKSGWYTNSKKWMEKFGINGFAEEVMEEEIGIPLHALLDGEGKVSDLLDAKQQLDIIGGMAISVGSMYAMGAGSRPVKGIYNRAQYYRFRNKVNVADSDAQNLMGDNWADIKDKIDNATNEQMGSVLADILRQRDTMTKEQINAAVNYGVNLMKMRGYNIAKTAEMNAKEITNEPTTPEEQHQADIDNAYSEGHDADDADKHDIQIQQEDQMKTLAAALGISEQQLSAMSDEELESLTGQDDKLDQAIYDYQLSSARYQGVVDDAQDKVDLAAHQAEQRVDMYTDQSRGYVRNATIKASGGLEDYGVYIISGNIATHDDGSIDVGNSDDMILYFDPTTNSVEHADALIFAELGEELPADDVKAQEVAYAKENAIKEVAGIIDGTVEVGSQFNVTDTDGTEHTYEVLADYGDGTAAISIDGNVVENPYSLADLQQMKDLEDQKRLEAAKAEREQMEKEREAQQTQNIEETQPSFDFNQILNDNGNVVLADVLGKDGNTKYPNSQLFLIRDSGAKAKVMELTSDGSLIPHAVNKKDVRTATTMTLDEYKQAFAESSMIEDNSGENRGEIEVETPTIEGETAAPADETAAPESAETPATEQTPAVPAITLEDGTIVPMLEDGNPDFSKLTAAQTAELYDTQFGEDADSIVSGYVSDAKKALDKASNMTVKGKTFVEQKAAKDAKEKAIADAQAAYDSAIAIRDAYNERQLAKVEDTAEGRKELIEKARRKFARLKSAVKDDAEAVSQLYRETIGSLLHRLYDSTGIDVTDTIPLTAEEYVASNLGAHSLNYEGTETSKGVKQETGLSREDFSKTQLLAADGKGTTIDALVHSLWENRPSNLESLDTQDIRNALIGVLNSSFKASEARNFVENIRIAQAENILEEQKRAQENAAYAEQHKAEPEAELEAKSDEKAELKAKSEAKLDKESDNKSNDLSNKTDNEKINDNINDNINVPEDATDENPLGAERDESDLPFSAKENGKQQTTAERAADVEKNKVDDMKVVDNIVGEKTRKAFERLAKMMGANIQWQYSDKLGNGWIQETKDADGNVHRTIFITLDSSITEGAQFIFGHEMTHQIKNLNPAAYNELTQLVLDTYGSDAFDKAVDETMKRYSDAGFSGRARDYYAEEVVADAVGEMIRDLNLAHTLAMKMSHPLLAAIHEILQKIKLAFFGTEYNDVTKNIIRSIEQAYVNTANGQVTNSETGEDVSFSLRQKPEPKKKGVGYKVFVLKDGKLYPPMVANPDGAATPVGVWLDADAAPIAGESKTGRPQVKQGGKGTQGGSGKLAYRPGWHLGVVPYAIQFNRKDAEGNKTLFPKNFVFAEVEYAADVDYQEEARQEGINPSGKYQHSLAGLKHLPTDGYYMYRTNPNPETDPWVITGAMKVNRILTRVEQADLVSKAGREPQQIQEGDIVTDDVVNSINQEIADAPKFSLKVYHGSGADFTEFDFDHMGEGAGSQAFGWGGYVTSSEEIGKSYVELTRKKPTYVYNGKEMSEDDLRSVLLDKVGIDNANILDDFLYNLEKYGVSEAKSILRKGDYAYFKDLLKGTYGSIRSGYQNKVDAAELILAPRNIRVKKYKGNLYEVDIPDDNGNNYLDWDAPITDELIDKVAKALPSLRSYDIKDLKKDRTFDNFYKTISMRSVKDDAAFNDDKAASKLLASLGYTGIKYKAGRNFGGAEEGDTNYVIFKPEDMKITEHTKFSLKTYHGTGANFDRFDTSHAYEGAGSETFGHGIYVTKSAKIGASYALKAKVKKIKTPKAFKAIKNGDNWFGRFIDNAVRSSFAKSKKETFNRMDELIKEDENIVNDETKPEWKKNAAQKELADFDKLKSLFEGLTEEDIPSLKRAKANRYEVEIPDDTGNNYLDWNKPMNKEQKKIVREGLEKLGVDVDRLVRNGYSLDKNFGDVYNGLLYYALNGTKFEERDSFVASSNFLSSLGFTGIKYYAGTIWGGAKKGDLNYVIFNEDDAKIVGNTKFSLKKVNDAFNQRLDELVKNPNQKDKILHLGRSSSFLKAGGIADADIELEFDKFVRKSGDKYKNNHPFNASDLKNLPMAIAEPIAVFKSTNANDHVVLTELQKDGKNFIVAIRAVEQHRKGGVVLEVNQITSLYPKEEKGIINWVNTGRISNVDKEKALHFIEALQPHAGTTITDEELKSAANIINSFETTKGNGEKVDVEAPKTFDEFLNHPSLKFSIKNEQQRKAAEDAYEYAFKLRPNKSSQYALVDMSNPSNSPQYYEKKVLADRWRRFYNKAVHNELDDVYKDAWGNYKLFDLDRPFADQVNEVKGDVPSEFNAPDVVANKNADNESGAEYHEYKQDEPSSITYKDRYKAFKQREANREKTAGLRKERKEVEDVYKSKSEERVEYNKQLMKEYMDEHGLSSENDIPYDVWDNLRSKSFEKYQDELDSLFNKYKDLDKQIKAVAEPRFSLKDEKIKSVAEKFGVNEDDVAMYANAVEKGSTAEAARARANIKRYLLQANEDKISSFKELMKYTVPVNESLKENFGDLDAMIEEQRKQVEAERNAMEAARKRAQEEEEKRQKHLDELSLIPTDELDKRYMDAIANNDESTAREMLDESARRKGYGDVDSDYQGQGAWAAPSNPQYESDEARRADIENSPDVNLEDIALGYSLQPDDYFDNPRAYMNNTAYGLESAHVIKNALDAIKNGEKDVKVKVYRAVPTSVKEGKLRNGDWVTPSKKYAEMHGDNRLEGKYRIIEDEVPANQLWWDGNDANEFGFDDGKEYRYKNAKNNRKLNDLITYDNKGNVIPPSKRFNSRKNDIRFSLAGERGAADMAEDLKSLNTPDEVDDAIKTAIEDMPSGWKMANKKMIHIAQALGENRKAEIAGEEPKFSMKDGTLIKAGTYFSGGGLVEEGLKGIIDPVVAVEYDEKISGVYRNNFGQHIVTADVRDVDPRELVKQIDGEVEYFHASPVCKNYSQAKSNHAEVELDKETAASTAEFINAVKPKVVTIENVKGYKDSEAMKTITDALDANGYTWDADVYNAADYGGYTNRERLIVRAVRDGKLPEKPKKMAHKSGWYEAVADIIPTLTEKKNGVAPWMDIRLKADGIDWRNIDKPLYVMGSAYADGKVPHAFADELLPTLRTKSGDVIVMPDGKVYRAMGRVLARVSGVSDDYKMPFSENLSHTIIGNGIPTQLTEHVIAPLLTGSDPKFSIRTYHGTGASFDKFDFSHMGEGEGSQAFGWGGYVTNSKDIAEDYTRRAKIRKDNGGFEFVTDMSANNKDMVRQYIYKYKDVNKGLNAMRKDLSSALEMFPDDKDLKELSDILEKKNEEIAVPDNIAYLYDVDIPDDNGDYLDWDAPLTDKQKNTIIKELRRLKIDFADFKKRGFSFDGSFGGNAYDFLMYALRRTKKWKDVDASRAVSKFLSSIGFTGIKYKAGNIFGGAKEGDYNYVIFDENNANIVGNTRFSLRYDQFEHDLNQWKKDNNLPKDAQRPTIPQRNAGESAVDFLRRVDEYRKQMALWKTAPTYEQHLLSDDTALGEFNRELQRGSVLKRIAFQDSMLAIRKAQEAIMKEVGVDRLNMAEDAYTAENRSHGKGKNEFEEYNNEFLQPLRKAYHQMKKILGDSYDNVRIYMMAKHGLERDAQMAFKMSLDDDYEDVAQRSAAYKAYKGDMNRIINDSDLEFGRVDFTTWRQRDNALRVKYSPSYMDYRYDKNGIAYDYSGLSALFDGSDFEEDAYKLVKDIEDKYVAETHNLWDATNAATKKILRDGYKAGMMSKDTYQYVRDMYSHYIPLRGWDGTTADQVWDYIGGGKGAFNQTLKKAHGRTSIADDPIAYIENMAESGILLNNKNWVKQHLMLLAQNHPTSLLTLSKAWYVKSTDANGNEEWIPATPQITSQMDSNQVKAAIDAFEKRMEKMAQTGDATQKRDGLNIAYPQTHSEEREHEVRVMKDGEEYVIYVNGDPQLAQAMNNTRAHRVREIQSGKLDRAAAWLGRKMAAAYTSLSPLFIPSNYFRDLTMTLASTAIREDAKYNYLLRKNLATSWNLGFMLRDYQSGKLREKVSNGNATQKEQMFYDFMMNGGETGFVSSLDVEDLKKKFKNDLKDLDRWKTNPVKVGHTIMDSIEFLNRAIEDSNRFAVYMTSIQYGRSIDEAVNDAKDVTLNFNRKGTGEHSWQTIRNLYLFINPAVQSLQTLGALAKHHPFKFTAVTASWLASGVLVPIVNVALMQLGAAFLGGDGDDDKDWYKDISKKYWQFSKWDRRNNFIMWVPTTHEFVKIPLAQEFRAFYGLGDMIASKMMGGELAEESWEDYGLDLVGQVVDMLPLDPTGYDGNIAVSLMPNAIRPVFELAFNVDFTGKPLFKDTEYNKYDPNFTKAYVGTPDWLVRASRMMNSIGNDYPNVQQNKWDALGNPRYNLNNPAVVDHVLSSYLGGAYTMGSQVLGLLTKSLNDRKEIKVADIPLVSKFVSNPDDRPVSKKQGDEFWDKKEYYDRASNTISKLKKQAKIDGDYSLLERFYGSEEYKTYKLYEKDVKDYKEARKKERAEESGDEYRPHQLNAEDIYNNHATPMDEFEDMKLKQLFEKLNSFKTRYDSIVDNAPNESDAYYNTNKAAIDAIDEISLDKQEISELKKGFLDDGKDAYNAEDMKQIRDLRKRILAVLEKANKVVVANQKAKAKK